MSERVEPEPHPSPPSAAAALLRKLAGLNWVLFITMALLIAWGVWAIYNATSFREGPWMSEIWRRHIYWAGWGLVVYFVVALVDYKWMRWGAFVVYALGVLGLQMAWADSMRVGSRSIYAVALSLDWRLAPSLMMAGIILLLGVVLGHLHQVLPVFRHYWLRIVCAGVVIAVPVNLVVQMPDLGSALVYGLVLVVMLLASDVPARHLTVLALFAACAAPLWYAFALKPYEKRRVEVFMDMLANRPVDKLTSSYMPRSIQTSDVVEFAVGTAGFTGKGPLSVNVPEGRSFHRTYYSAQDSVDGFIYSVIVEEFGFRGGFMQIVGTAFMLLQCVFVAFYARDSLGRLVVVGITGMMFAYVMQNVGMNLLMMPINSTPLPFISYGGTFLVVCMFLMGLVQSVWVHRNMSPVKTSRRDDDRGEDGDEL